MFVCRRDGTLARDLPPVRYFTTFVSPRCSHSLVYFSQDLEADAASAWLEDSNRGRTADERLTRYCASRLERLRALLEKPSELA